MTAVSWPASLPARFLREGYSETPGENVIRETMDTGPAKTRLRSTSAPTRVVGQMVMTNAQLKRFNDFYQGTLFYGTVAFAMKDQNGVLQEMNIVQPPSYAARADAILTNVSLTLEFIP